MSLPTQTDQLFNDEDRQRRALAGAMRVITRLYPTGTQFVYELIQNADDALKDMNVGADGDTKSIQLILRDNEMLIWNNGRQFDIDGANAICSVNESTKDLTQIGTHGIGFKAVYACTEQPEIYSDNLYFRIEGFTRPMPLNPNEEILHLLASNKTVFRLPFKERVLDAREEIDRIAVQLRELHSRTLLFLHNLQTVEWIDERNDTRGIYTCSRQSHATVADAHEVKLMYSVGTDASATETFLVFRRESLPPPEVIDDLLQRAEYDEERERIERSATKPQPIEIAFSLNDEKITSIQNCVLFAYLPTRIETYLNFVIQARYQTIPSRSDINTEVLWNHWLVEQTANMLPDVLSCLKTGGLLTAILFETLPSPSDHIPTFFESIRDASRSALREGDFTPTSDERYLPAKQVFYPHTPVMRVLFSATDMEEITRVEGATWLDADIEASKRALEILRDVGVREVTTNQIIPWLCAKEADWFESKDDVWVSTLYGYLARQKTEWERLKSVPLARQVSGEHVCANTTWCFFSPDNEQQQVAFAPFLENMPFLRMSLLGTDAPESVKSFLEAIGVEPLKPTRFFSWLLLRYAENQEQVSIDENRVHVDFLMQTLETLPDKDTRVLADSVCKYPFFLAQMSTIDETPRYIRPDQAYLPRAFTGTSDLETYFANNTRQFVDAGYIRAGDEVSRWCAAFKKIGVSDVPRRIQHDELSWNIKVQLYSGIGHTTDIATTNWNLDGLTEALKRITTLSDTSLPTALALWRLLVRMLPRDKTEQYRFLSGEYRWQYYSVRSKFFDSTFYTQLITTAWLPDESGNFQLPATLFAASAETRNVMGDSVRYLHPDLEIKEATSDSPARLLAECLGANLAPKTEEVIKRLQGLSGQAIDLKTVENIYRFLQRQSMTGRQALFKQQPLLYTSTPIPRWWTADKVFWDNERAIFGDERGYLTAQYSEALKPFFVSQGVTLSATFADYVTAVLETAARAEVTDNILTRMNSLYRRLWASLPTRETEEGSELIRMWQELCRARCWLGKCGDTWAFYYSSELVWNDHDHNTALFAGVLPFWIFSDVEALAHFLEVTHCSQAEIDFQPDGERDDLPEWTKKTRSLSPLIATFLDSPQLNQEGVATSSLDILNELNVLLIERAKVTYKLLDATVTDKEPLSSYLQIDEEEVTLWITLEADAGDYPDLIGDALQAYLGVAQIREFVSNLLEADTKKSRARVLSRWQKRGLRYQSLAGTEPGNNDGQIDNPQDEESEQPWQERGDEESAKRRSVANQQADYTRSPDEKGDVNSSHNTAPQNSENENPSDRNGSGAGGSHTTSGNNNPGSSSQGTGSYSAGRAGHRSSGSGNYGSAGGGGEGAEHKALKEKVALTPNLCGQNLSLIDSEYVLPSGDRVDVLLKNAEGVPIPVEIKPLINTGEYSNVWQAVKYKHLIATQQGVPCAQIRSILVAPNIPDDVKAKCLILGIDPIEISLP